MGKIKAIETAYNGYRFRSRLEARWAVAFDAMGIRYEYEPEGFDLGDGICYLPDFLLHGIRGRHKGDSEPRDVWVEVKGVESSNEISDADKEKIDRFTGWHELKTAEREARERGAYPSWYESGESARLYAKMRDEHPSLYVVGDIPNPSKHKWCDSCYDAMIQRCDSYLFTCELMDGDAFGLALCLDEEGDPWLIDENFNQCYPDDDRTDRAYEIARQARFEHGEMPAGAHV